MYEYLKLQLNYGWLKISNLETTPFDNIKALSINGQHSSADHWNYGDCKYISTQIFKSTNIATYASDCLCVNIC